MPVSVILVLFCTVFSITAFTALAGPTYFFCTVKLVHVIAENGEMLTDTKHLRGQIGSTPDLPVPGKSLSLRKNSTPTMSECSCQRS